MTKFYFVRHGQSTANRDGIFSSPDISLTDSGRAQSEKLGKSLVSNNIGLMISSPDLRARQTAEIIASQIKYDPDKIKIVEELHERRFGVLAGQPRKPEKHYAYTFNSSSDAETKDEIIARMKVAINKLMQIGDGFDGNVLIVGHTVSGYYMREILAGHETADSLNDNYHVENAEIIELT